MSWPSSEEPRRSAILLGGFSAVASRRLARDQPSTHVAGCLKRTSMARSALAVLDSHAVRARTFLAPLSLPFSRNLNLVVATCPAQRPQAGERPDSRKRTHSPGRFWYRRTGEVSSGCVTTATSTPAVQTVVDTQKRRDIIVDTRSFPRKLGQQLCRRQHDCFFGHSSPPS